MRGEPIVNTPTDAFNCFMGTELDYLVIGNCILEKSKQDPNLKKDYTKEFELDWLVGGVLLTGAFINAYLANFYHYIYQALFC